MKILVCYDGSKTAKYAVVLAKKHAIAFKAEVIVLHSIEGGGNTSAEEIEQANNDLEFVRQQFEKDGIQCETKVLIRGMTPAEDIIEYASERDVDEIIIGVKRRSVVGKLIFGSNAQYVILKAHCPVLTVK